MTSTLKADVLTSKTTNGDLTISGDGSGVPNLEAGFKVGGVAGVPTASIQDDAVTLAKMASGTDGNIISYDASGNPVAIVTGNDGQVLTSTGAGSPPAFEDASGGAWVIKTQATASSATDIVVGGAETVDGIQGHRAVKVIGSWEPTDTSGVRLTVRTSAGGAYASGSSSYEMSGLFASASSSGSDTDATQDTYRIIKNDTIKAGTGHNLVFEFTMIDPGNYHDTLMYSTATFVGWSGTLEHAVHGGVQGTPDECRMFKIYFNNGTFNGPYTVLTLG